MLCSKPPETPIYSHLDTNIEFQFSIKDKLAKTGSCVSCGKLIDILEIKLNQAKFKALRNCWMQREIRRYKNI